MSKDGGPAFPSPHPSAPEPGMTLRQWYAGQALAGLCACPNVVGDEHEIAALAQTFADAMLAAEKGDD